MDGSSDIFRMKTILGFGEKGLAVRAYSQKYQKDVAIKFVITDPNANVKNVNEQQARAMYEFTKHQTVELIYVYTNRGGHQHPTIKYKGRYLNTAFVLEFCDGGDLESGACVIGWSDLHGEKGSDKENKEE